MSIMIEHLHRFPIWFADHNHWYPIIHSHVLDDDKNTNSHQHANGHAHAFGDRGLEKV